MNVSNVLRGLARNDARLIRNDSFLIGMIFYPIFTAIIVRLATPPLTQLLAEQAQFDLIPYYPVIVGYFQMILTPVLAGVCVGFLLIDERDNNTIKALLVTPMPLNFFVLYRVVLAMLISFGLLVLIVPLTGLVTLPALEFMIVAAVTSLIAPVVALFFVAFAGNKVEGFALVKIIGTLAFVPALMYFIPQPWQSIAGILFPPYWMAKAFWAINSADPLAWAALAIGIVMTAALLVYFTRRFDRVAYE
jgi:fluoroquinolone transport system permease protein